MESLEARALLSASPGLNDDHGAHEGQHADEIVYRLPSGEWLVESIDPREPEEFVRRDALLLREASGTGVGGVAEADLAPLADTFRLHSLPSANHTIYLDFDSHVTEGTSWNAAYGITSIFSPAYDPAGNGASFTTSELQQIQRIWQRVAEDFAPFHVNVTTEDPQSDALRKSGSGDTRWGVRVVVTADTFANCGCGGHAYIGSFNSSVDEPVFVYNVSEIGVSAAASHEAGHALYLAHDGTSSTGYYNGHGSGETGWGPIMGSGYYKNMTTWDNGQYFDSNNKGSSANYGRGEDDLLVITTYNGFGYRGDDHGDSSGTATPLDVLGPNGANPSLLDVSGFGVISRPTDLDVFSFTTGAGSVNLVVNSYVSRVYTSLGDGTYAVSYESTPLNDQGSNLDVLATLRNAEGAVVATSNPGGLSGSFSNLSLAAGTYYLSIDGAGTGNWAANPPTGYSDYVSLGQYQVTGTIVAGGTGNRPPAASADAAATDEDSPVTIDVRANDSDPDGDALTVTSVTQGSFGSVAINTDGTLRYTPAGGRAGTDNFQYDISDGRGGVAGAAVTVTVADLPTSGDVVDLTNRPLLSYSSQDAGGTATVSEAGSRLALRGNTWKAIPFSYNVTPQTVLEFDFQSSGLGEEHAIGLEEDLVITNNRRFKLYGTQDTSGTGVPQDFNTYASSAPAEKHYVIPVGQYYTGNMSYLLFTADDDVAQPAAESIFRNLRISENTAPVADADVVETDEGTPVIVPVLANDFDPDGDTLALASVTQGASGSVIANADGTVSYTPAAGFSGSDAFSYTIGDGRGGTATGQVQVTVRPGVTTRVFAEVGRVSNLTHAPQTIVLQHAFTNPVVIANLPSRNGTDSSVVFVSNVQADRFTMQVVEAPHHDNIHGRAETVSYVVLESGRWQLADGRVIEVGSVATSATVNNARSNTWQTISFAAPFAAAPVVLTQVQGASGGAVYVSTRHNQTTAGGLQVAQELAEGIASSAGVRTIGYAALVPGVGALEGGITLEAGITADGVTHAFYQQSLAGGFAAAPNLAATIRGYDGSDSSHLRWGTLGSGAFTVMVEEDRNFDSEQSHTTEAVNYLAVGGSGLLRAAPLAGAAREAAGPSADTFLPPARELGRRPGTEALARGSERPETRSGQRTDRHPAGDEAAGRRRDRAGAAGGTLRQPPALAELVEVCARARQARGDDWELLVDNLMIGDDDTFLRGT